ncbi:MAG: hypothetical protein ACHQJX_11150 [Candidatus Acidiferrales bacterium]
MEIEINETMHEQCTARCQRSRIENAIGLAFARIQIREALAEKQHDER